MNNSAACSVHSGAEVDRSTEPCNLDLQALGHWLSSKRYCTLSHPCSFSTVRPVGVRAACQGLFLVLAPLPCSMQTSNVQDRYRQTCFRPRQWYKQGETARRPCSRILMDKSGRLRDKY